MKVKIADQSYDSDIEPIMLTLSPADIDCLKKTGIDKEGTDICFFPRHTTPEQVYDFMIGEVKGREYFSMPTFVINWILPAFLAVILLAILLR